VSNITNFKRDSIWQGEAAALPLPAAIGTTSPHMFTDGNVYQNVAFAKVEELDVSGTEKSMSSVGVQMLAPNDGEPIPYRVCAHGVTTGNENCFVIAGIGDQSDDLGTFDSYCYYPFVNDFDRILMMPNQTDETKVAKFGIGRLSNGTDNRMLGSISVQCTWFGHPRFGTAVY